MKYLTRTLLMVILLNFHHVPKAQIIMPYGGYIHTQCKNCLTGLQYPIYQFNSIVYFKENTILPDSIYFRFQGSLIGTKKIFQKKICNNFIQVIYDTFNYYFITQDRIPFSINALFSDSNIKFIGKNIPNSNNFSLNMDGSVDMGSFSDNSSCYFKDHPLIIVKKGYPSVFNFYDHSPNNEIHFFGFVTQTNDPFFPPNGFYINDATGDIYFDGNLDTGFYSMTFYNKENPISTSQEQPYYMFTVQVLNNAPYFIIPKNINKDNNNIPYIKVKSTDKVVNFQTDYINSTGLNSFSVNYQSPQLFNKVPQITTTKSGDILHININVFLDTGFYKVFENLPQSISIIVTVFDSASNCKEDMTSFYITKDALGVSELNQQQENIKIYPNPATNELRIESSSSEKLYVQLFDVTGKSVTENISFTNSTNINTSSLPQGIYFLRITDANNGIIKTQKVVVMK